MERYTPQPEGNSELKEKQILWDKTLEQLDKVKDLLGKPIDPGIKEQVAAFAVNGFPTWTSCEGHLEERRNKMVKLGPNIGVGFQQPPERYIGEKEIKENIANKLNISADQVEKTDQAIRAYWNYLDENNIQETSEFRALREKNEGLRQEMSELLKSFYLNRESSARLVILPIGPAGHFVVITGENIDTVEESNMQKVKQQLQEEQEEIISFGKFLKNRFFGVN